MASTHEEMERFIVDSINVLDEVVKKRKTLLPIYIQKDIKAAWNETKKILYSIKKQINTISIKSLRFVGLDGKQFKPKVIGWKNALSKLKEKTSEGPIKVYLFILKWMDIVIGSLISLLPAAEAVKEFIEVVTQSMDENTSNAT